MTNSSFQTLFCPLLQKLKFSNFTCKINLLKNCTKLLNCAPYKTLFPLCPLEQSSGKRDKEPHVRSVKMFEPRQTRSELFLLVWKILTMCGSETMRFVDRHCVSNIEGSSQKGSKGSAERGVGASAGDGRSRQKLVGWVVGGDRQVSGERLERSVAMAAQAHSRCFQLHLLFQFPLVFSSPFVSALLKYEYHCETQRGFNQTSKVLQVFSFLKDTKWNYQSNHSPPRRNAPSHATRLVRLLLLTSICRRFASSSSAFISRRHPDGSHYSVPPSGFSTHSSSPHSSWLAGWLAGSWCPERAPLHLYPSQACGPSPVILVQWIPCLGTDPVLTALPTILRTLNPHNVISPTVQKLVYIYMKNGERLFLH